jgi:molybdopterin-binding aldehyde dehydrogenase-like protein
VLRVDVELRQSARARPATTAAWAWSRTWSTLDPFRRPTRPRRLRPRCPATTTRPARRSCRPGRPLRLDRDRTGTPRRLRPGGRVRTGRGPGAGTRHRRRHGRGGVRLRHFRQPVHAGRRLRPVAGHEVPCGARPRSVRPSWAFPWSTFPTPAAGWSRAGGPPKSTTWSRADQFTVAEERFAPPQAFPFGAYVAVVEVDPDLGTVHVRRIVAVDDYGVMVNPMIVDGQGYGSIAQGLGQVLWSALSPPWSGCPPPH